MAVRVAVGAGELPKAWCGIPKGTDVVVVSGPPAFVPASPIYNVLALGVPLPCVSLFQRQLGCLADPRPAALSVCVGLPTRSLAGRPAALPLLPALPRFAAPAEPPMQRQRWQRCGSPVDCCLPPWRSLTDTDVLVLFVAACSSRRS